MSDGKSMLDAMAAGFMESKVNKAAKLTPLRGELASITADPIPNHPAVGGLVQDPDILLSRLKQAHEIATSIVEAITALEKMWGKPEEAMANLRAVDVALIAQSETRRAADQAVVDSIGVGATKADKAKAAAAAKRLARDLPIEVAVTNAADRDTKRAVVLAAMKGDIVPGEDFADRMARMTEDAKAQVFLVAAPEAVVEMVRLPSDGWQCPVHHTAIAKVSPRGREYRKCPEPGCPEFEKL